MSDTMQPFSTATTPKSPEAIRMDSFDFATSTRSPSPTSSASSPSSASTKATEPSREVSESGDDQSETQPCNKNIERISAPGTYELVLKDPKTGAFHTYRLRIAPKASADADKAENADTDANRSTAPLPAASKNVVEEETRDEAAARLAEEERRKERVNFERALRQGCEDGAAFRTAYADGRHFCPPPKKEVRKINGRTPEEIFAAMKLTEKDE